MNLVTRFLTAQRDRLLMRLGCWLMCFSLVIGLMLPQQRAEALVAELTMASVASVAAAYLGACGLPFITKGMDKDALVSSVQRLIQEFLDTELGGITIQDWLGSVTLTSTMEAVGEAVVDPPAGEITDVDNLGLPALGQALTSRFPFSIPWDFFRAVQLLAAPAKAPYFEVDFMKRFCLMLAGATKRLIWTA